MLGVTFGSKHSYNDWGIWLEDTHINPPLPKRYIVDVPARNGLLDLTPELTPTIRFENRTLTFNFRVKAGDWSTLVSQIYGDIHGRTLDVVSDLDPNWHWHGCVTVDDFSSDQRTGKLVITVDADPFKLSNTESSYTVNGNGTITCVVDRMEISPAFELTAPTTVIYGDSSYVLESTATTEKTLSGDIVSFADGTANPAVDLTLDIEAVQDLHGYDAPWVGGAGKNLLDQSAYIAVTGCAYSNGKFTANVKLNCNGVMVRYFDANNQTVHTVLKAVGEQGSRCSIPIVVDDTWATMLIGYNMSGNNIASKFSKPSTNGNYVVSFTLDKIPTTSVYGEFSNIQVEAGSTATDYAPYSNICPISGWDEVNVNVTGKNLFDKSKFQNLISQYEYINDGYRCKSISLTPNTTYTLSFNAGVAETSPILLMNNLPKVNESGYFNLRLASGTKTFTTDETGKLYIGTYPNVTDDVVNTRINKCNIQIELGSTATAYEPYNGQTYTIDLDGTRYGGTLDVTTGVLTLTHEYVDLGDLTWAYETTSNRNFFYHSIGSTAKSNGTFICSAYKFGGDKSDAQMASVETGVYSHGTYIYIKDTQYTDATTFKNSLTGQQLVYELATPQVVQLTAEQVMILKNQNNIWADSGEVEVTYLAQDFAGKKFYIPDLELTEGSHELTIQGTGTTKVTYTNGRL